MPKRERACDDSPEQAIKKQVSWKHDSLKIRNIRSLSSERTLHLLFHGSIKSAHKVSEANKCQCSSENHTELCYYCNKPVCPYNMKSCDICQESFCQSCYLLVYQENYECLCYSCLK